MLKEPHFFFYFGLLKQLFRYNKGLATFISPNFAAPLANLQNSGTYAQSAVNDTDWLHE